MLWKQQCFGRAHTTYDDNDLRKGSETYPQKFKIASIIITFSVPQLSLTAVPAFVVLPLPISSSWLPVPSSSAHPVPTKWSKRFVRYLYQQHFNNNNILDRTILTFPLYDSIYTYLTQDLLTSQSKTCFPSVALLKTLHSILILLLLNL